MSVEAWKSLFDVLTVVLLGLTFFAGAGVLITGGIINRRQEGQLRKFDKDLTDAKIELRKQEERAAALEVDAANASKGLAGLQKEASDAKATQQRVQIDLDNARAEAAKATGAAEQERIARLRLEEDISPRIIEQTNSAKTLGVFKGIRFAIVTAEGADLETRRTAGQIRVLCGVAGWTEDSSVKNMSNQQTPEEGVLIEANGPSNSVFREIPASDISRDAAEKLADTLKANKMKSIFVLPRGLSATMPPLPSHTMIIHVGLKPLGAYFINQRLKKVDVDEKGNRIIGNSANPN